MNFQMAGVPLPETGKIGTSSKSKGMSDEDIEAQLAKLKGQDVKRNTWKKSQIKIIKNLFLKL